MIRDRVQAHFRLVATVDGGLRGPRVLESRARRLL